MNKYFFDKTTTVRQNLGMHTGQRIRVLKQKQKKILNQEEKKISAYDQEIYT